MVSFSNIAMKDEVLCCIFLMFCHTTMTFREDATAYIPILNDTFNDEDLNLPPDINSTSILRFGHHRIHDCKDFKKAYICIMKCLELGYHIAQSNKKCKCVCFKDYVKGKYFGTVKVGWKLPTTSLPPWAEKNVYDAPEVLKASYEDGYLDSSKVTETTVNDNYNDTEVTGNGEAEEETDTTNHSKEDSENSKSKSKEETGEKESGEKESGEKGSAEKGSGEKESGEKASGEKESGEKNSGEKDSGEKEGSDHAEEDKDGDE